MIYETTDTHKYISGKTLQGCLRLYHQQQQQQYAKSFAHQQINSEYGCALFNAKSKHPISMSVLLVRVQKFQCFSLKKKKKN